MTQLHATPAVRDQRKPPAGSRIKPRQPKPLKTSFRAALPWYVMVLPALALVIWLIAYPFVNSFLLSFERVGLGTAGSSWVGWSNYLRAFQDAELGKAYATTLIFSAVSVALQLALAWMLALLLWGTVNRLGTVIRVLFAIPMLLSPVVVGVVWRVLLDPQHGWVPNVLGISSVSLLGDPQTALGTLIVVETWQWTPFMFLIIAAGLNAIPDDVIEAAKIDGASSVRLFRAIIWPLTLPVTLVAVLFRGLDALKAFDLPYNLTGGGPGTATQTIAVYLYRQAFTRYDQGYASVLAVITTLVMAAIAIVTLMVLRRAEKRIA